MKFPRIKALRPNKTTIVLIAAIGIGLLAALGARSYLSNRVADIEAKSRGQKIAVVVASADLNKGTRLSNSTVAVRNIPVEYAHSGAVAPDQFERIDGLPLAYNVKAGEMILWGLVDGKKVPTFSARVETGRRAITVPVDEINSISGLLEPGDLIDLMVTVEQKGRKLTASLMQSVQVMATGQRSMDDPKSGERRVYSTVTLDTDPAQAQNIIIARDAGRITALLRNPGDKTTSRAGMGDLAALLGAAPKEQGPASQEVPVLYGGRSGKIPPEGLRMGSYVQTGSAMQSAGAQELAPAAMQMRGFTNAPSDGAVYSPSSLAPLSPLSRLSGGDVPPAPAIAGSALNAPAMGATSLGARVP